MKDTTVLLSFLLCPLLFAPIYFGSSGISTIPLMHRLPLCQANHGKPLVAFGLAAFGLDTFGLAAFGLAAFDLAAFGLAAFGLTAFGLAAFGLAALGLAALG